MKPEKTNIEFLKDILTELKNEELGQDQRNDKIDEAFDFIDGVESDFDDLKLNLNVAENESSNFKKTIEEMEENKFEPDESIFVGLDTFEYRLDQGNLLIQQRVDSFVESLQKEFCVSAAAYF